MSFIAAESSSVSVAPQLLVIINRGKLLCRSGDAWQPLTMDFAAAIDAPIHQRHYLGQLDEQHCFALFYGEKTEPDIAGYEWVSLRSLLGHISEEYFQLAGRALQITRWYRNHQYCGACGASTSEDSSDRSLVCGACGLRFYPRISPCVIGLVTRGSECLLAQGVRHPQGLYSTLAGFVEPGESAEQAFAREVMEEVGVTVTNIRYFASQPWPFPGQLMIGFTADYAAGDIRCCDAEIVDAKWFSAFDLPRIPPPSTIAGQIIFSFVEQQRIIHRA